MVSTKIDAFHTCHLQGSISTILEKVPYHSNANEEQWLGQGYYFWTDSHFFATKWGERKDKYPNGYVITKFTIEIPAADLLDLVGNVSHQLEFEKQIRAYLARMGKELTYETARSIPVSKMLDHLREQAKIEIQAGNDFFTYSAIKAADMAKCTLKYPYLEGERDGFQHHLYLPTRQQLFISKCYGSYLGNKELFHIRRLASNGKGYQTIPLPNMRK